MEELQNKIVENEQLHMKIFDMQKEADALAKKHQQDVAKFDEEIQARDSVIKDLRKEKEAIDRKAREEEFKLNDSLAKLKSTLNLHQQSEFTLKEQLQKNQLKFERLKELVNRKVRWKSETRRNRIPGSTKPSRPGTGG